jgi:NAD(P)-dependent dehydrogenase (short-subunit alcohol dehydrogenase family)
MDDPQPIWKQLAGLRQAVSQAASRPVRLSLMDGTGAAETPNARRELPIGAEGVGEHLRRNGRLPSRIWAPEVSEQIVELKDCGGGPFAGEVALVSGGASGIGRAVVAVLLERGAAVVSLDLNPAVVGQFSGPCYLGIQVNLTDDAQTEQAVVQAAEAFGGLDMLVLNAGIFPPGIRIEILETEAWKRVMAINLDPNLTLLRSAYSLLKLAPNHGRVVINASKNVQAPGVGAAAYSSSKAAVTQLGRVAALEWAKDRIRVNMVHPDQVFDTGIWTEEVLNARAAHYGLTVEQYKRRNLLGVEISSRYVAEFIAEMLGPLFANITGVQIPIDGGSDRII